MAYQHIKPYSDMVHTAKHLLEETAKTNEWQMLGENSGCSRNRAQQS